MVFSYLVYNPKGRKPKKVHHNWADARQEAERIARKELCNIYILQVDAVLCPIQSVDIDVNLVPGEIELE